MARNTADEILTSLLPEWHKLLQGWSADGSLVAAAQEALMLQGEPPALRDLVTQWTAGDFTGLPPIALLSSADINGALGAYAMSTGTIYLNADRAAGASKDQVVAVLTEELGHHLDGLLNASDTPGDEGEYFSKLLSGQPLTDSQKQALRLGFDAGVAIAAGTYVRAEFAAISDSLISVTAVANGNEADGSPVLFQFERTGDTSATLSVGYKLFGTAQAGSDYTGSTTGTISFGAGIATATLSLPALADGALIDPGETIIARIDPASGYSINPRQQFATATITAEGMVVSLNRPSYPGWSSGEKGSGVGFAALRVDGSVVTWGSLGDTTPTGLSSVTQIYSSESGFAALKADGTVSVWQNPGGISAPPGLSGVTQIYSTSKAMAALKADGTVVQWGILFGGSEPRGLSGVTKIFSNHGSFVALKSDATIVAWGDPNNGGTAPTGLSGVTQICSTNAAFAALKADGSVVAWGNPAFGGTVPTGLSGVTQLFSNLAAFAALKSDGTVVGWGESSYGGTAPSGLSGVTQIYSTHRGFAALRVDGSVVTWGSSGTTPMGLSGVIQIFSTSGRGTAAGGAISALKADGTVVAWGNPAAGGTVPTGLSGVTQIFSTNQAFAALKADGTVVAWGSPAAGGTVPTGLSGVTQIFSTDGNDGNSFNGAFAALKADGTVVAWGDPYAGGIVPTDLSGVVGFANPFTDDRLLFVTLAVSPASVTEDGTGNLIYTFTRTGSTTNPLTVNYSIGGSADNSDYTGATPGTGKSITFAAGSSTATLTIDPTADTTIEADETVALTLATGTGYAIGTASAVVGTIRNDDSTNTTPTNITLSSITFNENIAAGSTIATLGTTDPDSGDTFSYALISGTGSTDNAAFSIAANQLKITTSPDFESKSSYSIRIRSTDAAGLSFEKVVALNVNDLPEQVAPPQGSTNTPSTTGNNSPATSVSNGSGTTIINNITNINTINNINSNNTTTNNFNNSINITGSFNGNTSAQALAGSLKLEDPGTKQALPVNGDSAVKTLAQLTAAKPLSDTAKQLLDRYIIKDPSSSSSRKASADDAGFIDFTLKTGSLKSLTAEIALASEVKATAYVKVNPNTGEAYDFTYDPVTGLGAELLDTNKNGLVDSLRIHLQDGGLGDVDGAVNGSIRDPGVLAEAPRTPVYRFYRNGIHFYTTSDAERDNVIKQSYGSNTSYSDLSANPQAKDPITGGWGYKFEGVAYQALDTQGTALYRFFSPSKGYHFVTTNAKEALAVIQNSVGSSYDLSNAQGQKLLDKGWGFQFEGNSYKVSTIAQTGMDNPVYRFFNATKGVHFYSSSMVEAKSVITNSLGASYATDSWISSTSDAIKAGNSSTPAPLANGWGYSFEGIAWYV